MASGDDIRATIERYLDTFSRGDREGWLDLFADGATVEDPVGTPPCTGREEIGAFWDRSRSAASHIVLKLVQGPAVLGREAAFAMEAHATLGDSVMAIPTIDVMTFDAEGRITGQRAFWDPAQIRPA